jgi:hypothetical protein
MKKYHLLKEIRRKAEPFDALFTWSSSEIGRIITQATGGGPSHVVLLKVRDQAKHRHWHVTTPRCRWDKLSNVINMQQHYRVELGRNSQKLADVALFLGRLRAGSLIGSSYDYYELVEHLLKEWGLDPFDNSDPTIWVCSSGAEEVYRAMGTPLRPELYLHSPQDLRGSKYCEPIASWEI